MRKRGYHTQVKPGEIARYVLLPGDPARAELIAKRFDRARRVARSRQFWTFTGEVGGVPISVTSTGIGCPAAAIAVEELSRCGADTFIRVGTAGAVGPGVKVGEVVIASAAIREEETSLSYVPMSYPAVASLEVTNALVEAAGRLKIKHRVGLTVSKDAFYSEEPGRVPLAEQARERWRLWRRCGVLATEMECSTIYTLCGITGMRAGAALAIIGPIGKVVAPRAGVGEAIDVAIEAVKILGRS